MTQVYFYLQSTGSTADTKPLGRKSRHTETPLEPTSSARTRAKDIFELPKKAAGDQPPKTITSSWGADGLTNSILTQTTTDPNLIHNPATMTILSKAPVTFKYQNFLPFGARGGVTRFFMLTQGIPFDEKLVPTSEWPEEKKRLVSSGENPAGTMPIIEANGGFHPQHIAVSRYMAKVFEVTSGDLYKDYVQDLVADEYQGFRDHWVRVTFRGSDSDKAEYKQNDVPKYLTKFDALYQSFKTEEVFLSTSAKTGQPLWGDAAVYGLLRDHMLSGALTKEDLQSYANLSAMYTAYEAIPAIHKWLGELN